MARVLVLGPVGVEAGGEVSAPSNPVGRALLAALAVAAPQRVSGARLLATVWADRGRHANLQLAVHRLRVWVTQRTDGLAVATTTDGYRLDLGAHRTDLQLVRGLTRAADAATDPGERHRLLTEAIALWRDEPMQDVPAHRRDDLLLSALLAEREWLLLTGARAALAAGHPQRALDLAERICRAAPEHEAALAITMRALGALGRRAEAIGRFQRARDHLRTEFGVDPGAELGGAYVALLRALT